MLRAPLFNDKGEFYKENAAVVLNAVKFLDARVKGSPLQRIEQKNMSLHVHKNQGSVSREDLDKELELLRAQLQGNSTPLLVSAPEDTE